MKAGLGNLAVRDLDQLAATVKSWLKRIQYRPALIDGFLAQTGLTLEPPAAVARYKCWPFNLWYRSWPAG